jgi:7,8-dihydro-6-hydroxymethylpterin dimethyltransferase
VPLASKDHNLVLVEEHVKADRQHDLDDKGIAKTAREEKLRARDEALKKKAEDARMERLYREHILGEKPQAGFVPLDGLLATGNTKPTPAPAVEKQEEVGAMGD